MNNLKQIIFVFSLKLFTCCCEYSGEEPQVLPDIVTYFNVNGNEIQLEGFKWEKNDEILIENKTKNFGRLKWFSLGDPVLVEIKSATDRFFQYSSRGFYTYIQLLTDEQKKLLANQAKILYHIEIDYRQILNTPLTSFECSIRLNETSIKGFVKLFTNFPLRMDFRASKDEIDFLKKSLNDNDFEFDLECEVKSTIGYTRQFSIYAKKQPPVVNICGLKYSRPSKDLQILEKESSNLKNY